MSVESMGHGVSIVSDYQAWVFLWAWVAVVLLYGFWRSLYRKEADAIRDPGPLLD